MSVVLQRLEEALCASGRRLTMQRRLILKELAEADGHLDTVALCDRVRVGDPSISLATVYRTLTVLKELGLVEEHNLGQERSHYKVMLGDPHHHFVCLLCGKVIEFDTPLVAQIEQELSEREGISVVHTDLHATGYCADCSRAVD